MTSVARVPRKLRHMKVDKARFCSSSGDQKGALGLPGLHFFCVKPGLI
jgi:hypothetical protein